MNKIKLLAVSAALVGGLPLAASAGEAGNFYVGAGIGSATYESADFVDNFGGDTFSDSDFAYSVFVGYSLTKAVAVELAYHDDGSLKDDAFDLNDVKVEPTMWTVMAVGTAPIADNFSAFGKVGVAFLSIDVSQGSGTSAISGSEDSEDLALGAGVQYDIGSFGIRGEVLWVDAEDADKSMEYGISGLYKFGAL